MRNEIIKEMHIDEYHNGEGLSNSGVKLLLDCPARYYAEYLDPNAPPETSKEHFSIGKMVHTLVLEPHKMKDLFYHIPKIDRRTTEGKKEYAYHLQMSNGKEVVDIEQIKQAESMASSIFKNTPWLDSVLKDASIEESLFWYNEEIGVQFKSRPDIYTGDLYIDLKTTKSARASDFQRSIVNYGYYTQAAMAKDALEKLHGIKYNYFVYLIVEDTYPYLTASYTLDDEYIKKGQEDYLRAGELYKQCKDSNEWPDYGCKIQQLYKPHWLT